MMPMLVWVVVSVVVALLVGAIINKFGGGE
jgi:hypothetical protein